jgi:hypothetical protein
MRTSASGIKFATVRSAGFVPETTAKPRATAPVVLHVVGYDPFRSLPGINDVTGLLLVETMKPLNPHNDYYIINVT